MLVSLFLENYSVQAEENLAAFGVACEKIQIPRSCIATSKDFKDKNVFLFYHNPVAYFIA